MNNHATMSPELDLWLERQQVKRAQSRALKSDKPGTVVQTDAPPCSLSDAEIDWLWPRYQRCSFPPATSAKRFARTSREKLTLRGKNCLVRLSHKFRRQIFNDSAKWTNEDFLVAVREAAARKP